MQLTLADILIVVFYFALISFIGYKVYKKASKKDDDDYFLAGRKITVPFFVASLVATWYGNIMGMGEFVYNNGLAAFFCFGLPYYIAALFFAIFVAKKIRRAESATIPEQIKNHYGKRASLLSSIIILIITIPAAYILMLGSLVQMFSGFNQIISLVIGTLISLLIIYHGGLKADIITNSAQFIFMYIGFGTLLVFSIINLGSLPEMLGKVPKEHLSINGSLSWQYIFAWYIIAFQTFIDPSFHQRCAAAKNPKTARNGILISIIFWIIFDFLTLMTGLYAVGYYSIDIPLNAYPTLADAVLPPIWKGMFLVALIATVMSTLESYAFISASTFGNDIFPMFLKKLKREDGTKIGLILTGIIGIVMAIAIPSAIDLIYKTSSIAVPALIVPLTVSYSSKYILTPKRSMIIMLSGIAITTLWTLSNEFSQKYNLTFLNFTSNFEPMIPGIILSIILGLCFVRKRAN